MIEKIICRLMSISHLIYRIKFPEYSIPCFASRSIFEVVFCVSKVHEGLKTRSYFIPCSERVALSQIPTQDCEIPVRLL